MVCTPADQVVYRYEVRQCGGLAEIARAVLALSSRLRLAGSLPPAAEGNAGQLQVLQRRDCDGSARRHRFFLQARLLTSWMCAYACGCLSS